jgi:hypothetical protein
MISICITVKNRSRLTVDGHVLTLFPNCVESIVDSVARRRDCELVVTDWRSDDWPLTKWLEQAARPLPVRLLELQGPFCRGRGRNEAARAAQGETLLFLDADTLLCPAVVQSGASHVLQGKAYFPVLYSFKGPEHARGWWRRTGYGNCMLSRTTYELVGPWPEYATWGAEDTHFYQHVVQVCKVVRDEVPGFYHQWHPDDLAWKDRYARGAG